MKKLIKVANVTWTATSAAASLFILFNMGIIIVNIIARRFFNSPIFGSTEIVSYASLITASLALAQNEWFDGNIEMTLIVDSLPRRASKILRFVDYVICSAAFTFISYQLVTQTLSKYASGDYSQDLKLPVWIFTGCVALGFIILTICIYTKMVILGYAAVKNEDVVFRPAENVE